MSAAVANDADLESFRAEARKWIEANFPKSLKGKDALSFMEGFGSKDADFLKWKEAMGEKGWCISNWPKPWGAGLSKAHGRVLQEERARAGALNPIGGTGVRMFGPTLLEYGNEEQKKKTWPGIRTGT